MKKRTKAKIPQWAVMLGVSIVLASVLRTPLSQIRGQGFLIASTDGSNSSTSSRSSSSTSYTSGTSVSFSSSFSSFSFSDTSSSTSSNISNSSSSSGAWSYEDYLKWLASQKSSSSKSQMESSARNEHQDTHQSSESSRAPEQTLSSAMDRISSASLPSVVVDEGQNQSEQGQEVAQPTTEPESNLGCFTRDGVWTKDRSACDTDQGEHVREQAEKENIQNILPPAPTEEPEEVIRERIGALFEQNDELQQKRSELARSIEDMRIKLELILGSQSLSDATRNYIAGSIQWLVDGIGYFSSDERTEDDINRMVISMKDVLMKIQELVETERVPLPHTDIRPIVERTEVLLKKFRESFVQLTQAGIPVDQNAIIAYANAQSRFDAIMNPCLNENRDCDKLSEVLDLLSKAQKPLQEALNEHPEIQTKVEQMFQ